MGRIIRVNELIKRDLSEQLHTYYRDLTVCYTITEVVTSPDLREARIYYSVIGNKSEKNKAAAFFKKHQETLRSRMSKKVILKYLPKLSFIYDEAIERGCNVVTLIDQMDHDQTPSS